jgi:hypothetical protein
MYLGYMHDSWNLQLINEIFYLPGGPECQTVEFPDGDHAAWRLDDFAALTRNQQTANAFDVVERDILQGRPGMPQGQPNDAPNQWQTLCRERCGIHFERFATRDTVLIQPFLRDRSHPLIFFLENVECPRDRFDQLRIEVAGQPGNRDVTHAISRQSEIRVRQVRAPGLSTRPKVFFDLPTFHVNERANDWP